MKLIGPRLEGAHNDGSARAANSAGSDAGVHFEFLRRIDIREEQNRVDQAVVVVHAVQDVVVCLGSKAVYESAALAALVIANRLCGIAAAAAAGFIAVGAAGHARSQQRKIGEVTAIQRKLRYLFALIVAPMVELEVSISGAPAVTTTVVEAVSGWIQLNTTVCVVALLP
jgi:hypothetical protein